jgi:phospholipid/cholesterol/gamma-HCH transport system substrate-binding protein
MKFRIRFADQIVGVFIIVALASLAFVIVMLGSSQRWFSRDAHFRTEFTSANGLSRNMPVLYKGFTIGNVVSFGLTEDDQVEAIFSIYEEYIDRVKLGSIVDLLVSPIGLGNQFQFHPGKGDTLLEDGDFVPRLGSSMARNFIRQGLADTPSNNDSISMLISNVNTTLDSVNTLILELNDAIQNGDDASALGQIIGSLVVTLAGVETLPDTLTTTLDDLIAMLDETLSAVDPILADINAITSMAVAPDGTVAAILDADGEFYLGLVRALVSLSGVIEELEKIAAFIPSQLPQIAGLITDVRAALIPAADVLVALTNNPLLRDGIPERVEIQSVGTNPRNIQF